MAKYKKVYKKGKAYTVIKSDGSKITRYSPGGYVKVKIKDSSKSSSSSSGTTGKEVITPTKFDPNKHELQVGITRISDGKVIQKAGIVEKPKRKRSGSSRRVTSTGQLGTIDITDTKTGARTVSTVDLGTGKTISSRKSSTPKIQLANIQFQKQEQAKKTLRDQLTNFKLTQTQDQKIVNKVLTGQTITPQENLRYNQIVKAQSDKLTAGQIRQLKNAPKDIVTGLYEVGKELVTIPISAVIGSYNYGKSLRVRYEKGENNPLKNDIVKLGKGTVSVAKFVGNNPKEAAAIVGLFAAASGKEFATAFAKNPVKTTTKAVAYLFPGTVLKGGAAVVKTGAKGVKTMAQAKRLSGLNKITNIAKQGSLTVSQTKKLDSAVTGASKISIVAKREAKVKTALRGILKERGVKAKRGASIKELSTQVKNAPISFVKKLIKKAPIKKVKVIDVKTGKVKYVSPKKAVAVTIKARDTTKYFDATTGKKITKKQFLKQTKEGKVKTIDLKTGKVTYKKPRAKRVDAGKKKPIYIDVTGKTAKKVTKKQFGAAKKKAAKKKPQKAKSKPKKVKVIDISKVDVGKVEVSKVRPSMFKSKKAQVRFSRQVQTQVQKEVREVSKVKKVAKSLKKTKKVPKKKVNAARKEIKAIKKKLNNLRKIIKNNKGIIIRSIGLAKVIDLSIKDVAAVEKVIGKLPVIDVVPKQVPIKDIKKKPAKDMKKKPAQDMKKKPAQDSPQKKKPANKTKPKSTQTTKQVLKKVPKRPKPIKKKPVKKPKKLKKFKIKVLSAKKKTTKLGAIVYTPTGKKKPITIKTGLPINRAKKVAKQGLDNSILGSVGVKAYGKTTKKDIKDTLSNKNRRKRSKKARVQNIVEKREFRLDTPGEKKGITFAKVVKTAIKKEKAKLTKTPKKAAKVVKKKPTIKKTTKVKKVSKTALKKAVKKKVIKKAVKKKVVKKKLSAATKKKISKALKKAYKKKVTKKIKKSISKKKK